MPRRARRPLYENEIEGDPGIPIDYRGQRTIDPTKNVLDLVRAESKYQDAMRDSLKEYQNGMRESLREFQNFARDSEAKRLGQLADNTRMFQDTIRNMLAESVRTTSDLVAGQLAQMQNTFNDRVSKLEAGAFVAAGKSSVADPQLAETMSRINNSISSLTANNTEATAKLTASIASIGSREMQSTSTRMGQGQVVAWIVGAAMLCASIATPLIAFLALRPHP